MQATIATVLIVFALCGCSRSLSEGQVLTIAAITANQSNQK